MSDEDCIHGESPPSLTSVASDTTTDDDTTDEYGEDDPMNEDSADAACWDQGGVSPSTTFSEDAAISSIGQALGQWNKKDLVDNSSSQDRTIAVRRMHTEPQPRYADDDCSASSCSSSEGCNEEEEEEQEKDGVNADGIDELQAIFEEEENDDLSDNQSMTDDTLNLNTTLDNVFESLGFYADIVREEEQLKRDHEQPQTEDISFPQPHQSSSSSSSSALKDEETWHRGRDELISDCEIESKFDDSNKIADSSGVGQEDQAIPDYSNLETSEVSNFGGCFMGCVRPDETAGAGQGDESPKNLEPVSAGQDFTQVLHQFITCEQNDPDRAGGDTLTGSFPDEEWTSYQYHQLDIDDDGDDGDDDDDADVDDDEDETLLNRNKADRVRFRSFYEVQTSKREEKPNIVESFSNPKLGEERRTSSSIPVSLSCVKPKEVTHETPSNSRAISHLNVVPLTHQKDSLDSTTGKRSQDRRRRPSNHKNAGQYPIAPIPKGSPDEVSKPRIVASITQHTYPQPPVVKEGRTHDQNSHGDYVEGGLEVRTETKKEEQPQQAPLKIGPAPTKGHQESRRQRMIQMVKNRRLPLHKKTTTSRSVEADTKGVAGSPSAVRVDPKRSVARCPKSAVSKSTKAPRSPSATANDEADEENRQEEGTPIAERHCRSNYNDDKRGGNRHEHRDSMPATSPVVVETSLSKTNLQVEKEEVRKTRITVISS